MQSGSPSSDPNVRWDGERWMRWDGERWVSYVARDGGAEPEAGPYWPAPPQGPTYVWPPPEPAAKPSIGEPIRRRRLAVRERARGWLAAVIRACRNQAGS
jgi:hypothetical protein